MPRADVAAAAVDRAVRTARVDPDAGPDERCLFDLDALREVIRLCDSAASRDVVLTSVDAALQRSVEALDSDATLAAVTLRTRIEAATARRQLPVENIQGDVGTGLGPVRD